MRKAAFELASVHCSKEVWPRALTTTELASWSESISKQFRAACRHIMQGQKTAWYRRIFTPVADGEAEGEGGEPEGEGEEEEAKEDDEEEEEAKAGGCHGRKGC